MTFRFALARMLAALTLGSALGVAFPQAGQDPLRTIERFQDYLERKPFHERALESLVEAAISVNRLGALVEEYEQRLEAEPRDRSARVVLARLYARTDQVEDALAQLEPVEERDAPFLVLLGSLHAQAGDREEALAALDSAVETTQDVELLKRIHATRGEVLLASGERERAYDAFHALAEVRPEDLGDRLEAANALARNGLFEEALREFEVARGLAEGDVAKRCRVLSEIGRLHEQLTDAESALAAYDEALGLLARGHWLKKDLYERILAIHRRSGMLEELVATSRERAQADDAGLDAREFHARVLAESRDFEAASEVLRLAAEDYPNDLALGRQRIEVLRELEDVDGLVAEYQRLVEEHPEDLDLYLELGQVFASEGRLQQAKLQWDRTLEARLQDAGLCLRIAALFALYEMTDDAVAMYDRAIELEPREVRHYADLAAFLATRERADEALSVLERASTAAGDDSSALERVAQLWTEYGRPERAREALEAALVARPDDTRLLVAFADVLLEVGEAELASEILHRVINTAREHGQRKSAIDRLLQVARRNERLDDLAAAENARIEAGTDEVAPYLVLGRLYVMQRVPDRAVEVYEQLLELEGAREDARRMLARLYQERGETDAALAQYEALIAEKPQARRTYLQRMARLYLERFDQDRAIECYDEILRSSPDNPAAFVEVADAYGRIGLHDEALECLQQAVRLQPEDGRNRLKLAEVYRHVGEWGRARAEIEQATRSDEEEVQEEARKRYYVFLSEANQVSEVIDDLRQRIENNPYDTEAPIALTDIYERELEYELALEMLDRQIDFQPREAQLLGARANLQALMGRHNEAIAGYEELWKLPDADRAGLAAKIAEASLAKGDRERATRVLSGVSDQGKVAAIYTRNRMHEEAIASLEKGVAAAPADDRLRQRLVRAHEKLGNYEDAVEHMERLAALRGDSMRTLDQLGDLYSQLDRDEDVLECGRRMFALVQLSEPDEDESASTSLSLAPFGSRSSYDNLSYRLSSIHRYFERHELQDDFVAIGSEELRRQPTNETMLGTVLQTMAQGDDRQDAALALVDDLRESALATGRTPPGYTPESWIEQLDSMLYEQYRNAGDFAKERTGELRELTAGGTATERDVFELFSALRLGPEADSEESIAVLQRGHEAFPSSMAIQEQLAKALIEAERHDEAEPVLRTLIDQLEQDSRADERRRRADLRWKARRRNRLQEFPLHVQKRVDDETLLRLDAILERKPLTLSGAITGLPEPTAARGALATCLAELERTEEARAIMASLEPENVEALRAWGSVGNWYFDHDMREDAERIYDHMRGVEARLFEDPLLGHNGSWMSSLRLAMQNLARIYEDRGEYVEAYDLLRSFGEPSAGELLLVANDQLEAAVDDYSQRWNASAGWTDDSPVERAAWRDAGVRLAEVHQYRKQWEPALEVYEQLAQRLPEDFAVLGNIAALFARSGRWREAVTTHERIIEAKRKVARRSQNSFDPPGRVITPIAPPLDEGEQSWVWDNLRATWQRGQGVSFRENYTAIIKLYLDNGQIADAAQTMRELARQDVQTFSWLGWTMMRLLEEYQLGAAGLPIARLVYNYDKDDESTAHRYGMALVAAKRYDEAEAVLSRLANSPNAQRYYRDQARRSLDQIEARSGADKPDLAQLREAAAADPKSVKTRLALARKLLDELLLDEALAEVKVAEEMAPHQLEVTQLATDCLRYVGQHDEVEARLREELERSKVDRTTEESLFRLAEWLWARGDRDGVAELFDRMLSDTSQYYQGSPAVWYAYKGELELARDVLVGQIERASKGRTRLNKTELQAELRRVHLLMGDPNAALDFDWEQLLEADSMGAKAALFGPMTANVARIPLASRFAEEILGSAEEHGGVRGATYAAAYYAAIGDLRSACDQLAGILTDPSEEALFLVPTYVRLAREAGRNAQALAILEIVEERELASETRNVFTSAGQLSELQSLRAEKASLLLVLGRKEDALAQWALVFEDEGDQLRCAGQYVEHGLFAEAEPLLLAHLEREGERESQPLELLATVYSELGRYEEAIDVLGRAEILVAQDENSLARVREQLVDAYRAGGLMQRLLERLEESVAADPHNGVQVWRLARFHAELGDEERALELLEGLGDDPGVREKALTVFATRAVALGMPERAVAAFEELLDGTMQSHERRNHARAFAKLLFDIGETERAIEVFATQYEDPDTASSQAGIARELSSRELYEQALPYFERAAQLDSGANYSNSTYASVLIELGREQEALDMLYRVMLEPVFTNTTTYVDSKLLRLADKLGEVERLEEALGADPENRDLLVKRALLAFGARQYDLAIEYFERVRALDEDDRHSGAFLWRCYYEVGDLERAVPLARERIERLDRERGLMGDSHWADSTIRSVRRKLTLPELDSGNLAAARSVWDEPVGRRYGDVRPYNYSLGSRGAANERTEFLTLLWAREMYPEYLQMWSEVSLKADEYWLRQAHPIEARYRSGDRDGALAELWRELSAPEQAIFEDPGNRNRIFGPGMEPSEVPRELLLRFYREEDREDEFLTDLRAKLDADPANEGLQECLRWLQGERGDYALLLEGLDEQIAENPHDPQWLSELARTCALAGDIERAIELAERAVDLQRGQFYEDPDQRQMVRRVYGQVTGPIRFTWGGAARSYGSSYSSSWSSTAIQEATDALRHQLVGFYLLAGRRDEGLDAERAEIAIQKVRAYTRRDARLALAELYTELGLREDAERLYVLAAEDGLDEAYESLVQLFDEAGDAAKRDEHVRSRLDAFQREIEKSPRLSSNYLERARFRTRWRVELDGARADLERAEELGGGSTVEFFDAGAWLLLRSGESGPALEQFERAAQRAWEDGRSVDSTHRYGIGLALAADGQAEAARKALLRAWAEDPENPAAPEALEVIR